MIRSKLATMLVESLAILVCKQHRTRIGERLVALNFSQTPFLSYLGS